LQIKPGGTPFGSWIGTRRIAAIRDRLCRNAAGGDTRVHFRVRGVSVSASASDAQRRPVCGRRSHGEAICVTGRTNRGRGGVNGGEQQHCEYRRKKETGATANRFGEHEFHLVDFVLNVGCEL